MKKQLYLSPILVLLLSGCGMINETMWTLQRNRDAIDASTQAINDNAQAIEQANIKIEENRQQLESINKTLKKAAAEAS